MPRSNQAKTYTLRVSLVSRLQKYHSEELQNDPRATNKDFGGFINDKLEQLLDKEDLRKSRLPNFSVLSISDNVMYIKDKVLQGVVEVYYVYLKDLDSTRLFCGHDQSFTCMHVVYALVTLDISKMDPSSYKEALDNMGKVFMREVKHMLRREKTFASRQRPLSKKIREENRLQHRSAF